MNDTFHAGLVVYSDCSKLWDYRVYVVDLDVLLDTGMPLVRRIDDCAFHASSEDPRNMEDGWLKREERKLSREIHYGDVVSWYINRDMRENGMESFIIKFRKISNKSLVYFPTRFANGEDQVLLEGVINPNDPAHLFTEFFNSIRIPVEKQHTASPNVYFKAWVTLKLSSSTGRLMVLFDSFDSVCEPARQLDVRAAPWNKGDDKYLLVAFGPDSDDEDGGHNQKRLKKAEPKLEIENYEAVRTGDGSVLIWKLPEYKAIIPLPGPKFEMKPGECYAIDAIWNRFEKMYVITRVTQSRSSSGHPSTDAGLLRVSVKENDAIRGLFENELLGPIDDPKGMLKYLHLSPLAKNAIPLVVSDGFPSRGAQFRFQVEDIHGNKKEKLAKWVDTTEIKIDKASGVVLGDGEVFSAAHSPIFFKFAYVHDPPPIGTFVKFSAIHEKEKNQFRIVDWCCDVTKQPLKSVIRPMDPKNPDKKQAVFFISAQVPTHPKLKEILMTTEFGLVDDNLELLKFDPANRGKQRSVWVTAAHYSSEDPFFSRTVFQVVGVRPEEPEERVKPRPELTEDERRIQESFAKILEESKTSLEPKNGHDAAGTSVSDRFTSSPKAPLSSISSKTSFYTAPSRTAASPASPKASASPAPPKAVVSLALPKATASSAPPASAAPSPTSVTSASFKTPASTASSTSSASPAPGPSTSATKPTALPMGLFSSHARSIRSESSFSMRSQSSASQRPPSEVGSDNGSMNSDEGRRWKERREQIRVEPYTGPVFMPEGSNMQYDVLETLKRIRFTFKHTNCGLTCEEDCPWMSTVANLIIDGKGFWKECMAHFPDIATELMKSFGDPKK